MLKISCKLRGWHGSWRLDVIPLRNIGPDRWMLEAVAGGIRQREEFVRPQSLALDDGDPENGAQHETAIRR